MAAKKVMNLGIEVTLDSKGAIKGFKQLSSQAEKTGRKMKKGAEDVSTMSKAIGGLGAAVAAAAIARGVGASVKAFGDFEEQLKNVQNITGMSNAEIGSFQETLAGLPSTLGSSVDLTKGLYQALSSGVPRENVMEFIEKNAMAAKGNLADLTQTISASASIMNAFGLEGSEVGSVLDSMTKTVDLGVLTFGDLAGNIGKASAMAANAGMSYNELFAATAQLTKGGLSVEESITGIRAVLVSILKPGQDAQAAMKDLGIDMSATRLKAEGLGPIMADIGRIIGDDAEAMARIIPNIRGLGPALTLAKNEAEGFADTFEQIGASGGKVEANFANMSQGINAQLAAMKVEFTKMLQTIGEELAPIVLDIGNKFIEWMPVVADWIVKIAQKLSDWGPYLEAIAAGVAAAFVASKVIAFGKAIMGVYASAQLAIIPFAGMAVAIAAVSAAAVIAIKLFIDWRREMKLLEEAENNLESVQKSAHERLKDRIEKSGMSVKEFAEKYGVVAQEGEKWIDAIKRTNLELIKQGEHNSDLQNALKANSKELRTQDDATRSLEAATAALAAAEQAAAAATALQARKAKILVDAEDNLLKLYEKRSKWVKDQEPVWEKYYKAQNTFMDKWVRDQSEMFHEGEISFKEFSERMEEASQALWQEKMIEDALEWRHSIEDETGELVLNVEDSFDAMDIELPPVDTEAMKKDFKKHLGETEDLMSESFSSMLGDAFMGEWNTFGDLWDNLWQDAAKSMMGIIGDALGQLFKGGGTASLVDAFDQGIGGMVGGAGMAIQGAQQGGAAGAMQGAMGGAMLGGSLAGIISSSAIAGPIGMAIGAVAGLAYTLLNKEDDPRMSFGIGPGGADIYAARAQKMSDADKAQWERDAAALYNNLSDAYRGAFLALGQGDLWGLVGADPTFDTGRSVDSATDIHMDDQAILQWLGEVKLPEMFEGQYFDAFKTGLMNFGMNAESVQALFRELGDLTGAERIAGLTQFIMTVRKVTEQLADADWETLQDQVGQGTLANYVQGLAEVGDEMDVLMGGWDDMDLLDVAREVDAVSGAFDGVTEATAQMISEIQGMRDSIATGWADMIEDLRIGQMGEEEAIGYFTEQIGFWMDQLGEATTLEGIDEANQNLMDYVNQLMNIVDPASLMGDGSGQTWGEWLETVMGQAAETADVALDAVEDEVQAAYEALVERLLLASDALLTFTEAVSGVNGDGTGLPDGAPPWAGEGPFAQNLNVSLSQPMTVNTVVTINGQEVKAIIASEVSSQMDAMEDWVIATFTQQEIID
jgi:TP901 family phage tail tape measure protein